MTKKMVWLTANIFSLNISKPKYILITNILLVHTGIFVIKAKVNYIKRTAIYKYLGVILDENLTWKEHCK